MKKQSTISVAVPFCLSVWTNLCLLLYLLPHTVSAASANDTTLTKLSDSPSYAVVLVLSKQNPSSYSDILNAIRSQLIDLPIIIKKTWVSQLPLDTKEKLTLAKQQTDPSLPTYTVWFELLDNQDILLTIIDQQKQRMLVRTLPKQDKGAQSEALAIIVRSAIVTMSKGGTIGLVAPSTTTTKEIYQPPPVQKKADRRWLAFKPGLLSQMHSQQYPFLWGIDLQIGVRPTKTFNIVAGYTFIKPISITGESSQIHITPHLITMSGGYAILFKKVDLLLEALFILNRETQQTERLFNNDSQGAANKNWIFALCPQIRINFKPSKIISLFAALGLHTALNPVEYTYKGLNEKEILVTPFPIQPRLSLGFEFWIF